MTEYLGGIFYHGKVQFAVNVQSFGFLLVGFSPHTKVTGWDSAPASYRPPFVTLIQLMVAIGFGLLGPGVAGRGCAAGTCRAAGGSWPGARSAGSRRRPR